MKFSLRLKILFGLALISVCAMSFLIMILRSYLATTLETQLVKRGEFIAQSLAEHCVNPILSRQNLSLDLMLHENRKNDDELAYLFVVDPAHNPLSHTFTGGFPTGLKELNGYSDKSCLVTRIRLGDQDIVNISAPILEGQLGRLHVGMAQAEIRREIDSILFHVSGVIALLFLGAAVAMWLYLNRVIIRPIREMDEQIHRLGQGHFDAHTKVYSGDELGSLGNAFNTMGQQLNTLYSEVSERNQELSALNVKLEELAITDGLTGLYNHRHFYERLTEEVKRSKRYHHPLSLIMGDIDHFKCFNDTCGHVAGDKVLQIIAALIAENARENDLVARYGGEEFAIILPETPLETARLVAERMRSIIESSPELLDSRTKPGETITMSFGVTLLDDATDNAKGFVRLADAKLYQAKQSGRNRVIC